MPYFTDETKFKLPVSEPKKEQTEEGWVEQYQDNGFSHQQREFKRDNKTVVQFRKVKI